ncbi:hypothetical protein [Paracnuella aquatica]|uniref:hypothetical protein n=1 Tax=Paracnuella aquatica TaxID=2268757 RepID=UPI000F50EA07|nr:hypothetical protein [Paracnuella aquatica]RPD43450.1 hypothetical protein DRJ53_20150 [Paracnuella aquatica]
MKKIRITKDNIKSWSKYETLLKEGKIKFDSTGRLRYLHGAPVGDLIQTRTDKKGQPIFQEIAEEWFDPDSQKAKEFIWP